METTKENQGPVRIGFWRDPRDPDTKDLPEPRDFVDPGWDPAERAAIVDYLKKGKYDTPWMGFSFCRFHCGISERALGTWDLTDGKYLWPEGYAHYVEKHAVKPPEEFLAHVREQLRRRAAEGGEKTGRQET